MDISTDEGTIMPKGRNVKIFPGNRRTPRHAYAEIHPTLRTVQPNHQLIRSSVIPSLFLMTVLLVKEREGWCAVVLLHGISAVPSPPQGMGF